MTHKHEPLIGIDSTIWCRTCGEVLFYAETELCRVSSAKMARKTLTKLAYEGNYKMDSIDGDFIVYSKERNSVREEVTIRKEGNRVYIILQKLIRKED